MDNVSNYINRRLLLQKILRTIRIIALFMMIVFLVNYMELDSSEVNSNENLYYKTLETPSNYPNNAIDIEEFWIKKARNMSIIGSLTAFLIILITIPIELVFVRCPKCNSYIFRLGAPNFCAKCGLKFNNKDDFYN